MNRSAQPLRLALAGAALGVVLAGGAFAYSGDHYKVCRLDPNGDNYLVLRAGPSSRSREVVRMGPGYDVEVRGPRVNGRWFPAATTVRGGQWVSGYVFDGYVCPQHTPQVSQ